MIIAGAGLGGLGEVLRHRAGLQRYGSVPRGHWTHHTQRLLETAET
jgi:hypothetical protein